MKLLRDYTQMILFMLILLVCLKETVFSVSKNGIYFQCEIGIELNIRDIILPFIKYKDI